MTQIKVFNHEMFGTVRTMTNEKGETFFVGKDVAKALGYKNPQKALRDHVDEDDKGGTKCYTLGGNQKMTVINESGLYALILSSKPRRGWFEKAFLQRSFSVGRWHCQLVAGCLLWASSRAWKWQKGAHTGEKSKKDAYFLGCYI